MSKPGQRFYHLFECSEVGHDWRHVGGVQAACGADHCCCSVPLYECQRCKIVDYGDNAEAKQIVTACQQLRASYLRTRRFMKG